VSGTAPVAVQTIWINGTLWPITWTSVTNWTALLPLHPGTNQFSVAGLDTHGQPISGASDSVTAVYVVTALAPPGQVVINEIMYNPRSAGAQYVELYNTSGTATYDLSGWQLVGLSYTFPPGSLMRPGSYLVLAADRAAFAAAYGGTIPVFDTFSGVLPAGGELLSLISTNGQIVTQLRYQNGAPWPPDANGTGASLQLIDPLQDNWRAGNWTAVDTSASQWSYYATNGTSSSSTLYIYPLTAGDCYLDDLKLVSGSVPEIGANVLADGDFESGFPGPWTVSPNLAASALSTAVKHSGNASLHVVASAGGQTRGSSIYQDISPTLPEDQPYALSFWYRGGTNVPAGGLVVRLSGSGIFADVTVPLPALSFGCFTPGTSNVVAAALPSFPPLWINELQPDNLTGVTNKAGQRTGWLELYNPTTNAVSLDGLWLANTYTVLGQWPFPTNASIKPGEFKVIFADSLTNLSTTDELHTSFTLASGSGSLILSRLYNGHYQVLDFIDYTNLPANYSYGSFPNGQSFDRRPFFATTPGSANVVISLPPLSYISYNGAGLVYSQNFDTLPNPGAKSVNTANPVTINGITYSLANPFSFSSPVIASGNAGGLGIAALGGWYGMADPGASVGTRFGATDGDQTTGGILSFGLPSGGNRALGLLATSTTGFTAFGVKFVNDTAQTLTCMTLQLTGEVWRQSNLRKTLQFYYLVDPTATASFSTAYTALVPSLNVGFPTVAADVGGVAVDGTSSLNQTNLGVVNLAINWPPGAALWLAWEMADPTGKAQGLGIDNFVFAAADQTMATAMPLTSQLSGTNFTFSWPTLVGQSYQPEYNDYLCTTNWIPLGGPISGTGSLVIFTNDLTASHRFFRLRLLSQ